MKVLILTEGGNNIGLGHITRCISLYQAFEERGMNPEFIINGDDTVGNLLSGRKYQIFNWLKEENRLFKIIKNAPITIVDSYLADAGFYKRVSEIAQIPIYIDDNKRIDYPKGIVVSGTIYAKELDYPKKNGVTYLLGSEYIPIRREFWDVHERKIRGEVESVMVTFGGDDAKDMTPKILKFLNDEYPELVKKVIIGRSFESINIKKIESLKCKKVNLIYSPDAERMKEAMLESDIAISGGGQTLYELARIGVPTVGICITENQSRNIEGWRRLGFLEYIGWHNDRHLIEKLRNSMKYLNDKEVRKNKSEIGRKCIDGKGSLRIVGNSYGKKDINNRR